MAVFDILLCVCAVCMSGGAIGYTQYLVRTNKFERPTEEQIRRMIDTAPPGKFDDALARRQRFAEADL